MIDGTTVTLLIFGGTIIFAAGGVYLQLLWLRADIIEIKTNHLPHLQHSLDAIDDRLREVEVGLAGVKR